MFDQNHQLAWFFGMPNYFFLAQELIQKLQILAAQHVMFQLQDRRTTRVPDGHRCGVNPPSQWPLGRNMEKWQGTLPEFSWIFSVQYDPLWKKAGPWGPETYWKSKAYISGCLRRSISMRG